MSITYGTLYEKKIAIQLILTVFIVPIINLNIASLIPVTASMCEKMIFVAYCEIVMCTVLLLRKMDEK